MVGDASGVRPANIRTIGDQAVARAGEVISRAQDEPDLAIAILVVRRGTILRFFVGGALAGDPLSELTHIAETVVD